MQALADLHAAIRYGGDGTVYESPLSDIAFWLRRYHEAIVAAQRAVALSPGSVFASINLAQYVNLAPGSRPTATARADRLLVRDWADTPGELRNEAYAAVVAEIDAVAEYRPDLAGKARLWRRRARAPARAAAGSPIVPAAELATG